MDCIVDYFSKTFGRYMTGYIYILQVFVSKLEQESKTRSFFQQ